MITATGLDMNYITPWTQNGSQNKKDIARDAKKNTKRVDISVGLLRAAAGSSAQPHGSSSRRVTH